MIQVNEIKHLLNIHRTFVTLLLKKIFCTNYYFILQTYTFHNFIFLNSVNADLSSYLFT